MLVRKSSLAPVMESSSEFNQERERIVLPPAPPAPPAAPAATQPPPPLAAPTKTSLVSKYKVDLVFESSSEWERRVLHPTPSTLHPPAPQETPCSAHHNLEAGGSVELEPELDILSLRGEEEMSSHAQYERSPSRLESILGRQRPPLQPPAPPSSLPPTAPTEALVYTLHPAPAVLHRDLSLKQIDRNNGSRGGVGRRTPQGTPQGTPRGTPRGTPQGTPERTPGHMSTPSVVPKDLNLANLDQSNVSGGRGGGGGVPAGPVASVSSPLGRSLSADWRRFENMHFVSSPSPRPEGVRACVRARARVCVPCASMSVSNVREGCV